MIELKLEPDRLLTADGATDTHFVSLAFRAPRLETPSQRMGVNLSLVLDRSGSMGMENKLPLAKRAVELALARLSPNDRYSLVIYDHEINVLTPSTFATPESLHASRVALAGIGARGNTALFDGYLRGTEQVAAHLTQGVLGKVLLLTDGLANVGLVHPETIVRHVAELRARGVQTSTFGVGADFNQVLLNGMATSGGGHFYFIERAEQLEDLLTSEVGEALETVAREVRVLIEHGDEVKVSLLDAFTHEPERRGASSRLGALTSEQIVELVYAVEIPGRPVGETTTLRFGISDEDGSLGPARAVLEFRHAPEAEVGAEVANAEVLAKAAKRIQHSSSEILFGLNYVGRYRDVRPAAAKGLNYLKELAKRNPEVNMVLENLEQEIALAEAPMDAMVLKKMYFENALALRGRNAEGKARK